MNYIAIMHKSTASTMFPSTSSTPKATPKVANYFRNEICRIHHKPTTYAQFFKKRIDYQKSSKLPLSSHFLNRSLQKYSSLSREGSAEKSKYRTNHMEIQSNILNISINSCGSNENEDHHDYENGSMEGKYPDEDFIRVEDFKASNQGQERRERLEQEYQAMVEQIQSIQREQESQQAKIKTVDKSIKEKKKLVVTEKPISQKEGLAQIEHELNKEISKLEHTFKKNAEETDISSLKLIIELEGLKQKWENLNTKEGYLVRLKKEEEMKEAEFTKQAAQFEKQKKQEAALLTELGQIREDHKKLEMRLSKLKGVVLPTLDVHRKYVSMLERSFIEDQIHKIDSYLVGKREHAQLKKKSSKIKEDMSATKVELEQTKKKLDERSKRMAKLRDEMNEKSSQYIELTQEQQRLDALRLSM